MVLKHIVLDIATDAVAEVQRFYSSLFGLEPIMDVERYGPLTQLAAKTQETGLSHHSILTQTSSMSDPGQPSSTYVSHAKQTYCFWQGVNDWFVRHTSYLFCRLVPQRLISAKIG